MFRKLERLIEALDPFRESVPVEQGALAYVASQLRGLARNPALSDSERDAVHHVERLLMRLVRANRRGR